MKCGIPKPRGVGLGSVCVCVSVSAGCMEVSVDRKIAIALEYAEDGRTIEWEVKGQRAGGGRS